MNVLLIGNGGREHALAWKLLQSPRLTQLWVAPGNAGTAAYNAPIAADDIPALVEFAKVNAIALTVVGPEAPLAAGIVDAFTAHGLRIFGPSRAAAKLEASKVFAKRMMRDCGVPTAMFEVFDDYNAALRFMHRLPFVSAPAYVIKADGLAAGKGVFVCDDLDKADQALTRIMIEREFGAAGDRVLIEERMNGPELSVLAFTDGKMITPMPPARDHKRVGDGDTGPNTGGMGAFVPVPDVTPALLNEVFSTVLQPVIDGMRAAGTPYVGVLYAGLMLTEFGVRVLEFNCRFGDPETQVILPLLQSDLIDICEMCVDGRLDPSAVRWSAGAAATVVLAAPGYPGAYPKGAPISGLDTLPAGVTAFHAGTAMHDGAVVTNGGRVLSVTACGENLSGAVAQAYAGLAGVRFDGMHYRRDIGVSR